MRVLGIVPARAGSKGCPGKNTRDFMGKPLVAWAIECSKRTCMRTMVTTDDPEVMRIAAEYGVDVVSRPTDLARDDTPMHDVLRHACAMDGCEDTDAVALLQPTQPLRTDSHVKQAFWVMTLKGRSCDSVQSVVEMPLTLSPDYVWKLEGEYLFPFLPGKVTRRQDCRVSYYRDGTVYLVRPERVKSDDLWGRSVPLVIKANESCGIDTEDDWNRAEQMWRLRHGV